ncbi:hypothetical protein OAO87_00635, partial [bacterium]|nr:hypothetical protein [bacterium]
HSRSARSKLEQMTAEALTSFASTTPGAVRTAGAVSGGPFGPPPSSYNQSRTSITDAASEQADRSPTLNQLRGMVSDDVGEESLDVDTDLATLTVDYILSEVVGDPSYGRSVGAIDGQLVRLLLRYGLEAAACRTLLVYYLTTTPAVNEALAILLGAAPSDASITIAPIFRSLAAAPHDRTSSGYSLAFASHLSSVADAHWSGRDPSRPPSGPATTADNPPVTPHRPTTPLYDQEGCAISAYSQFANTGAAPSAPHPAAPTTVPGPPSAPLVDLPPPSTAAAMHPPPPSSSSLDRGHQSFAERTVAAEPPPPAAHTAERTAAIYSAATAFIETQQPFMRAGGLRLLGHCRATGEDPIEVLGVYYESHPSINHDSLVPQAISLAATARMPLHTAWSALATAVTPSLPPASNPPSAHLGHPPPPPHAGPLQFGPLSPHVPPPPRPGSAPYFPPQARTSPSATHGASRPPPGAVPTPHPPHAATTSFTLPGSLVSTEYGPIPAETARVYAPPAPSGAGTRPLPPARRTSFSPPPPSSRSRDVSPARPTALTVQIANVVTRLQALGLTLTAPPPFQRACTLAVDDVVRRCLNLGIDAYETLTPRSWWVALLPTDVANKGVRHPSKSHLEVVESRVRKEERSNDLGTRERPNPLSAAKFAELFDGASSARSVVYVEARGAILLLLNEGWVCCLSERQTAAEASSFVLEELVKGCKPVPTLSTVCGHFGALRFDGAGDDGIIEIFDRIDHELLLASDDDAEAEFNSASWNVGETAAVFLQRLTVLGQALRHPTSRIISRFINGLRQAKDQPNSPPRSGEQTHVGLVVDAFATRGAAQWTSLRDLEQRLNEHSVASLPLPPRTRGRGNVSTAHVIEHFDNDDAWRESLARDVAALVISGNHPHSYNHPIPPPHATTNASDTAAARDRVAADAAAAREHAAAVAAAVSAASSGDGGGAAHAYAGFPKGPPLVIPDGPLQVDKILASNRVAKLRGRTRNPIWNSKSISHLDKDGKLINGPDGKYGRDCFMCCTEEPQAIEERQIGDFMVTYGRPGRETHEALRKCIITHHEPWCRPFRRCIAIHVRNNPVDKWMLDPDPDWPAALATAQQAAGLPPSV